MLWDLENRNSKEGKASNVCVGLSVIWRIRSVLIINVISNEHDLNVNHCL
jgi:hypothetical protein